ncbi:type I-E CRISPR-associated protein Cas5/CasD [Kitasatospora sp. NPDC098663]|uniref:type I-E CRISPR-associated protein Cas5/CasD n=1 Tax=Kitasatospora sp. NPDC098663 TaxID=3364096 RepID=UPI0037F5AAEB
MSTRQALVLRLTAPMQSWGVRGGFADYRDTATHPTRSGVLGLLGAALGQSRSEAPGPLTALDLTVRIDRPGTPMQDYQTIGGQSRTEVVPCANGHLRTGAVITRRAYLADAAFTVILTGPAALLRKVSDALDHPVHPPYLGRRACPPTEPYNLGIHQGSVTHLLKTTPLDRQKPRTDDSVTIYVIATITPDDPRVTHTLNDDPHGARHFAERALARSTLTLPAELCSGRGAAPRYTTLHEFRYGPPHSTDTPKPRS